MLKQGLVQIYTGKGKGKTTASLGLALRACGDGNKVLFYQFLKPASLKLSERKAISSTSLPITVEALSVDWDMYKSFSDPEILAKTREAIKEACEKITTYAQEKRYNVIILDEIVFCHSKGLIDTDQIKKIIDSRDPGVEIVMTGRDAGKELIELADLVSEINPVKHPYDKGIVARKGIEY